MVLGSIIFGPTRTAEEVRVWRDLQSSMQSCFGRVDHTVNACNCMGPQGGEKMCPCMLAAEMVKANEMLRNGVTIAGKKYRLVPEGN